MTEALLTMTATWATICKISKLSYWDHDGSASQHKNAQNDVNSENQIACITFAADHCAFQLYEAPAWLTDSLNVAFNFFYRFRTGSDLRTSENETWAWLSFGLANVFASAEFLRSGHKSFLEHFLLSLVGFDYKLRNTFGSIVTLCSANKHKIGENASAGLFSAKSWVRQMLINWQILRFEQIHWDRSPIHELGDHWETTYLEVAYVLPIYCRQGLY